MARLPRFDLAGIPQHIVQRGNNRLPCFLDDGDRLRYLQLLREAAIKMGVQLHAYVLMDNHVHLLATPPQAGAIGRMMQSLGRQFVGAFNARHGRTGTLWEGRYKACIVDSDQYVLRCYRYIELNPVRARLIDDPAAYRWSSCAANLGQRPQSQLTPQAAWLALGYTAEQRADAYRRLLDEVLDEEALTEIRDYLQQQRAFGRDGFRTMVEAKTKRFAGIRPAHRPRRPRIASK
jgi:putative transposase